MENFRVSLAVRALRAGRVIAYPTEAVWGLGCDPFNPEAVQALLWMKNRPVEKGMILVADNMESVRPLMELPTSEEQQSRLKQSWPGPNTWLVPASRLVPEWIRGRHTKVALRVSAHPLVQRLCREFGGPIVSTSANPAGCREARSVFDVRKYFGDSVVAVPGALGSLDQPTTIRDLVSGETLRG
jgi:L-threonylcarbamoyladenylate synthase